MLAVVLICLVVGITDGDSITARCPTQEQAQPYKQERVRLTGIDAPERGQPWGNRARQTMSELVYQKEVKLDCGKRDRYQRLVCDVYVAPSDRPGAAHSRDVGLVMVERGMAWWYRAYQHELSPAQRGQYRRAENRARREHIGLWQDANPVAPWDWRRQRRKSNKR